MYQNMLMWMYTNYLSRICSI